MKIFLLLSALLFPVVSDYDPCDANSPDNPCNWDFPNVPSYTDACIEPSILYLPCVEEKLEEYYEYRAKVRAFVCEQAQELCSQYDHEYVECVESYEECLGDPNTDELVCYNELNDCEGMARASRNEGMERLTDFFSHANQYALWRLQIDINADCCQ